MRNWVLDGSLIVASCMKTGANSVPTWLEEALSQGHRFWVYVGQLQSMRTDLTRQLTESGADQPEVTATSRLASFLSRCQWLAALAEDGDVLAEVDLIGAQLRKAAARLDKDSGIVTDDRQRIAQGTRALRCRTLCTPPAQMCPSRGAAVASALGCPSGTN